MTLLEAIKQLDFPAPLPPAVLEVEQRFDAPQVDDPAQATVDALSQSGLSARLHPGASVALGVGSRGIANLPVVVRAAVQWLRNHGCAPFIVPAMGSHGHATPQGQMEVLAALGVTGESVGAEVRATMDVTQIGQIPDGPPLFQGDDSRSADHTLLISRVKPHTDFRSHLESGPSKMAVIGLGKQRGAEAMHEGGGDNFRRYLEPAARIYAQNTNLVGALCLVENAYDQTARIEALTAEEIGGPRETSLLELARSLMASLPFPQIDVLVVREIGKNISGTGFDTNIIGRLMIPREPENFGNVDIAVIALLDLTPETHGHATGMGLANITTARVVRKIDWVSTYTNALTAGVFSMWRHSLPITLPDDRRALQAAVRCCGRAPAAARLVMIPNTLHLDRLWISSNLRKEAEAHERLRVVCERPLAFDEKGVMVEPWRLSPVED